MNIACDIRVFLSGETGVGTYYKNLLSQLAVSDRQNRYLLFSSSWKERFPYGKIPGFVNRRLLDARVPVKVLNWLWYHWQYPPLEFFFREKIAVAHSPTPMLLPCRGKRIITIYDLFFVTDRQLVQPESRRHFRSQLRKNVNKADGIICISQATRSRLLEMFPWAAAKIEVIYLGVAPFFFENPGQPSELRKKYLLPEKYILFIGTIEPRKNLSTLLRALLKLKQAGIVIPLVIAGSRGWGANEFLSLKKELGSQVHEIGYVEDADLPFLYREAQLFVFPSLAEGFGLPLLESLASGTPVLCSDIPVFHEIGQELPTYFKTIDVPDLAEKINVLWKQNKETAREARIAHARNFTWQNTAAKTLAFYRQLNQGQA
jgi:glycosyltransferase involved in cell wall biosynthesis